MITVSGQRLSGQIQANASAELTLTQVDIAAYGVSSIGELLSELLAETSSGRARRPGPPVVLLDGRRIPGFREIGRYPVEALARVEVLAENVAVAYGFSANERVINFILKQNVAIAAGTLDGRASQAGGSSTSSTSQQWLRVNGQNRTSLDVDLRERSALLESERTILDPIEPESSRYTSLIGSQKSQKLGFSIARTVFSDAIASVSGGYENTDTVDHLGLSPTTGDPLTQSVNGKTFDLGFSLVSRLAPTTWSVSSNLSHNGEDIRTGPVSDGDIERAKADLTELDINMLLNSQMRTLENGPLRATLQIGLDGQRIESMLSNTSYQVEAQADRVTLSSQASISAPIKAPGPLPGLWLVNANGGFQAPSDFDALAVVGSSITWETSDQLSVSVSTSLEGSLPSLDALYGSVRRTPGVRTFDPETLRDVQAVIVDGGIAGLDKDKRWVWSLGFRWTPGETRTFALTSEYTASTILNETRRFTLLTDAFETAFPHRVTRNEFGELQEFDRRPVVVDRSERQNVRTTLNWNKRIQPQRVTRRRSSTRRRSGRPGRTQLSIVHSWIIQDDVQLQADVGDLDFLAGAADSVGGGTSAHQLDVTYYRWNNGLGHFVRASWRSPTEVDLGQSRLRVSQHPTIDTRVTYEFNYSDTVLDQFAFLEETRVTFGVDNVLAARTDVTDNFGQTPLAFQPDLLSPLGRVWRLELRKRF